MTTLPVVSARFRLSVVAAFAAGTLALAGCQGATPGDTETTTAVATPSATPTPTPIPSAMYKPADPQGKAQNVPVPVKPALADENSKAGLEAFVGYWYHSLWYGYETGDTSLVAGLSKPTCVFCKGLKDAVDLSWKDGRWISGGQIEIGPVAVDFVPNAQTQAATVQTLQKPIQIHKADGTLY